MTLHLRPETVEALSALAQTHGMSVEDYVQELVNREWQDRTLTLERNISAKRLSPEEWAREFEAWADSFPDAPPIPDEALSRENLYPDRW